MTYEKDSFDREDYLTEEDWEELASEHLAEITDDFFVFVDFVICLAC